jgi:hypothetical protein
MELTRGRNPASRVITKDLRFSSDANLAEAANQLRSYLGVTIETQQSWPDDETALKEWRQALQSVGVYIFKDAFKADEFLASVYSTKCSR